MLGQHVFSHQYQHPPADWPQSHHQTHTHHAAQQHAQAQAAAAAAAAAQQQHYNRIAANNNPSAAGMGAMAQQQHDQTLAVDQGMTEENRRVLEWIAQLMNPQTRETALLELSKKREQVPELAMILWHSFGTCRPHAQLPVSLIRLIPHLQAL